MTGQMAMADLHAIGHEFDQHAKAPRTLDLYGRIWADWLRWCSPYEASPLPASPEVVAAYATHLAARLRPSSIGVHLAAITHYHREAGLLSPTEHGIVRKRMAGIRRAKGIAPSRKSPLVLDDLDLIIERLGTKRRAVRDRAMLMLGWAAGLRRTELVGLDALPGSDGTGFVRFTSRGLDVVLTRSKTDQDAAGQMVAIPLRRAASRCPVRLLQRWIDEAGIESGPLFRPVSLGGFIGEKRLQSGAVALAVKRAIKFVGLDPRDYAGHSLRAGFATTTIAAGAPVKATQDGLRHRKIQTTFEYVRAVRRYDESALLCIPSW